MTLVSQSLAAQQTASDSAVARRPERSILGWAEVVGMTAITGMAFSRDQLLRNRLHDRHDALGRTLSDLGERFRRRRPRLPRALRALDGGKDSQEAGHAETGLPGARIHPAGGSRRPGAEVDHRTTAPQMAPGAMPTSSSPSRPAISRFLPDTPPSHSRWRLRWRGRPRTNGPTWPFSPRPR